MAYHLIWVIPALAFTVWLVRTNVAFIRDRKRMSAGERSADNAGIRYWAQQW